MKTSRILGLVATGYMLPCVVLGAEWLKSKNKGVADLRDDDNVGKGKPIMMYYPEMGMEAALQCREEGMKLQYTKDNNFARCCARGQHLEGSPSTAFDCCAKDHTLAGSKKEGFKCCPKGAKYEGGKCRKPKTCNGDEELVGDKCVPRGTDEDGDEDGSSNTQHVSCESGIDEGTCYLFKLGKNDQYFTFDGTDYRVAEPSSGYTLGRFQFCKSKDCDEGSAIEPGDEIRIRDVLGGDDGWLDNPEDGSHISRASKWDDAGEFSITKWTCGQYCLTGFENGISPACPADTSALSFDTVQKQNCQPLELVKVPCDVRAKENNCAWAKTPGSCGVGDKNNCMCS